jgi:hypothetical protein
MSDPIQPGPQVPSEDAATPPVPPAAPVGDYFAPPPFTPPPPPPPPGYPGSAYPSAAPTGGAYPSAYPGAPVAYGPARRTSGEAIGALVLSILSWTVCPLVPAIIALVLAARADREIKAGGGWVEGAGMVTAARIVSWINIAVSALSLAFFVALFVIAAVSGSSTVQFDSVSV